MHLKFTTKVNQNYRSVMQGFTEALFIKLNPPFPPVKLIRFDGCKTGDVVSLELNFIFFKQCWESLIIEDNLTDEEFYFIDEGRKLPFFLKYWRHKHRIIKNERGSEIVDDVSFRSPTRMTDFLLYPLLWLQFLYRKPVYRQVFSLN